MQEHPAHDFPPLDDFLSYFAWFMRRHRASFTREQFARRMEYGLEILKNYYNTYINTFPKIVAIERNIRSVADDLVLKGKLDKIEFNGRDATIVDYKTGDPERSKDKFARPNAKDPNGGDYWRQAVFYKIMLDHYATADWNVTGVIFDFIEPTKRGEYHREKVAITPVDVELVKEQIKTVNTRIQNHDFYTGCGKEDCHWCRFVKTNKLAVALHEIQEEEPENVRILLKSV
jgi:DNA helicase-2/ATP-dependent DNA helicase PcrA